MKKFMTIWIGELISNIGSGMTAFALSVYVYQITKSAGMVSLVTVLAYMPTVLLSPIGGILADRYDRRLMMILGDLLSGLGLLYILIQIQMGNTSVTPIIIGVTINSVFVALLEPSFKATITDLLTEEEYAKASGLVQMAGNARYLISPAIAGLLLGFFNISLILIIDICTLFVTAFAVATVRKTMKKTIERKTTTTMFQEFKEGFRVLFANKGVSRLVGIMTLLCFCIGFVQTLCIPMTLAFCTAKEVGILESLSAVGMLAGSVLIAVIGMKKKHAVIFFVTSLLCGFFMGLVGVSTNPVWITVTLFLFFTMIPFMNTSVDVLIRTSVDNSVQGRVWGLIGLLTQSGTVLAYMCCGILADKVFEPMFTEGGLLADSVGKLIGTGEGRGIGFSLILAGLLMMLMTLCLGRHKAIRQMKVKAEAES